MPLAGETEDPDLRTAASQTCGRILRAAASVPPRSPALVRGRCGHPGLGAAFVAAGCPLSPPCSRSQLRPVAVPPSGSLRAPARGCAPSLLVGASSSVRGFCSLLRLRRSCCRGPLVQNSLPAPAGVPCLASNPSGGLPLPSPSGGGADTGRMRGLTKRSVRGIIIPRVYGHVYNTAKPMTRQPPELRLPLSAVQGSRERFSPLPFSLP